MTKDVLVSISGLHTDITESLPDNGQQEENPPIEVVMPASYFCKNGKHYVIYDEVVEGIPETIKNKIKITGTDCVEIMKTGAAGSHMIFEKDKKNLTCYQTPYGQMLVGVETRQMDVVVTDKNIDVFIRYELDVNYEPMADCEIRMNITDRHGGDFRLVSQ